MVNIVVFAAALLLATIVVRLIHTYIRLRHVPGPALASWNDFWRLYAMNVPVRISVANVC